MSYVSVCLLAIDERQGARRSYYNRDYKYLLS